MRVPGSHAELTRLPSALPTWHGKTDAAGWKAAAATVAQARGRLLALWASGGGAQEPSAVHAAYALAGGLLWLELALASDDPAYPDLAALFPAAGRMQRAAGNLSLIHI